MQKYDLLVDFDTALVSAAAVQQSNTINVKHLKSGKEKPFQTRTLFKAWLKENPKWSADEFVVEDVVEVIGEASWAVNSLKQKMHAIKNSLPVRSVKFAIGGSHGNFRDKVARIQPYKGQRPVKPVLFNTIKKLFIKQCGEDIIQPQTNYETDDLASIYLFEDREKGKKSKRAISSPDKDLKMCIGWHTDANEWDNEASYTEDFDGFYQYAYQGLRGDAIDHIQGIPILVDSVQKKFGLRKTKGFGPKCAEGCLEGCTTKEQLAQRVAYVYKETFPDGLVIPDGTTLSWIEVMDENMQLLKMLDYEGQQYIFSKEWNIT